MAKKYKDMDRLERVLESTHRRTRIKQHKDFAPPRVKTTTKETIKPQVSAEKKKQIAAHETAAVKARQEAERTEYVRRNQR